MDRLLYPDEQTLQEQGNVYLLPDAPDTKYQDEADIEDQAWYRDEHGRARVLTIDGKSCTVTLWKSLAQGLESLRSLTSNCLAESSFFEPRFLSPHYPLPTELIRSEDYLTLLWLLRYSEDNMTLPHFDPLNYVTMLMGMPIMVTRGVSFRSLILLGHGNFLSRLSNPHPVNQRDSHHGDRL